MTKFATIRQLNSINSKRYNISPTFGLGEVGGDIIKFHKSECVPNNLKDKAVS